MLLENKDAMIYGCGGSIGGAVARAFVREGAKVFLAGRTLAKLDAVAKEISAEGGVAATAQVDALDEQAVEKHATAVAEKGGGIDVSFDAISMGNRRWAPHLELSREGFTGTLITAITTHYLTARAAARRMIKKGSGVIWPAQP